MNVPDMTLLDWFAGQVIATGLGGPVGAQDFEVCCKGLGILREEVRASDVLAYRAYGIAESMMNEKRRRASKAAPLPLPVAAAPTPAPAPAAPASRPPTLVLSPEEWPLERLNLTRRAEEALRRASLVKVGQILEETRDSLREYQGIGPGTCQVIIDALAHHHLYLRPISEVSP